MYYEIKWTVESETCFDENGRINERFQPLEIWGDLIVDYLDDSKKKKVGYIKAYVQNYEDFSFASWDCEDSDSADLGETLSEIIEKDEYYFDRIIALDKMEIRKKHQGKNLGYNLIKELLSIFGTNSTFVIAYPHPLDFVKKKDEGINVSKSQLKRATLKLTNWYRKMGFLPLREKSQHYAFHTENNFQLKDTPAKGFFE